MATLSASLILSLRDRVSGPARGVTAAFGRMRRGTKGFAASQRAMAAPLGRNLRSLALLGAGYLGVTNGISGTIGAAMSFEDSMSDIRKVVDFKSPHQFKTMSADILDLTKKIPLAAGEIAAITAAAGQANIPYDKLLTFTEMTAKVSTAWDTAAGETGQALANIRTALGLTVSATGLVADAINHLGNNTAASAPKILRFSRGLSSGMQAGFAANETLAFGAAMISSGFQAEVAETSFRNMTKSLIAGESATKKQSGAFKKLGFDTKKISRDMQKDAVGTTLAVLDAIKELPKDEQGAVATALFGSEARALPALINNTDELRRVLGLVGDEAKYAGSAAEEYEIASKRTSNTLKLLRNNVSAIGIGIGDKVLGPINTFASRLADTLMTLDKRVTVFDRVGASVRGFFAGLGFEGGTLATQFTTMWDTVFGRTDTFTKDVDSMGASFETFRRMGDDVRSFGSAIGEQITNIESFLNLKPGTIVETLGQLSGYGFSFMIAATGFSIMAGAITKLAGALLFLSGMTTAFRLLKGLAYGGKAILGAATTVPKSGAAKPTTTSAAPVKPGASPGATGGFATGAVGGLLAGVLASLAYEAGKRGIEGGFRHFYGDDYMEKGNRRLWGQDQEPSTVGKFTHLLDVLSKTNPALSDRWAANQNTPQANTGKPFNVLAGAESKLNSNGGMSSSITDMLANMDRLAARAEETGGTVSQSLSVEVTPIIDTSSIDAANAKARTLSNTLRSLPGANVTTTTPGIAGARAGGGPVSADETYLVGEEGAELVTPSRSGYVHDAGSTAAMMGGGTPGGAPASAIGGNTAPSTTVNHISLAFHVDGAQDPEELVAYVSERLSDVLSGIQADTEWSVS